MRRRRYWNPLCCLLHQRFLVKSGHRHDLCTFIRPSNVRRPDGFPLNEEGSPVKKLIGFLLLCLLLLCCASTGYCRGKIEDGDAYETYYGKSKSIVRVIAPNYEETNDGKTIFVDTLETENDGFISLYVDLNGKDIVNSVSIILDPNTMKTYFDGDMFKLLSYSLSVFGLDPAHLTEVKDMGEGNISGTFEDSTVCMAMNGNIAYVVNCRIF